MTGKGYVVKTMTMKIGAVSYECEITGLVETESHDTQSTATACPDGGITDVGPSTFTLDVSANVVLDPTSLYVLLTTPTNYGTTATIEYAPDATGKPLAVRQASVVLVPAGGDFTVGAFATFTVSLPCKTPPTWKTPPTAFEASAESVTVPA